MQNRNIVLWIAVLIILSTLFSGCSPDSGATKGTIAHSMPEEHHLGVALKMLAEMAYEKSDGEIQLDVFPAGQLYTDKDMMQAVEANLTNIGMAFIGWWSGAVPSVEAIGLPFLFDNEEHTNRAVDEGLFELIDQEMAKVNTKLIMWAPYGFGEFTSNRPIYLPEDLKNLKVRSITTMDASVIETCGGIPVQLGGGEVYMALQRGTVDAAISGITSFYLRNYYEVQDYATIQNMAHSCFAVVANLEWWNSLDPKDRKVLEEAAADIQTWLRDAAVTSEMQALEALIQTGQIEVIDLRDDYEKKNIWRDTLQPVWDKVIDLGGDTVDKIIQVVEETRE